MMEDDDREMLYRDYTATMQRHAVTLIGRYMFGKEWQELPSYIDLAHNGAEKRKDEAEEAKQHINEIFGVDIDQALKRRG